MFTALLLFNKAANSEQKINFRALRSTYPLSIKSYPATDILIAIMF